MRVMKMAGPLDQGLDLVLDAVPTPPEVDVWVRQVAGCVGIRPGDDFVRIAAELIDNAHRHADGPYRVRLWRVDDCDALRVQVVDRSPSTLPVLGRPDVPAQGSGLVMVNRLSSHWGFECDHDGKTVWAEVRS
ncbi:ATP-binding protein [Saccharothrix longispora]|nr:ATP-binding protein [Saccharothrix longispora]MDU0288898.1 ATP-binding protein [Saccharothrix longispora]